MNSKFTSVKDMLTEMKDSLKEKQDLLRDQEKQAREQHAGIVEMEEKARKLTQLIEHNKRNSKPEISDFDAKEIEEIRKEIALLEDQKNQQEMEYKKMFRKLQFEMEEAESERNIISVKLKEKEQESRLNDLKIKELNRSMPYKSLKPLNIVRDDDKTKPKASTHYPSNSQIKDQPFQSPGLSKVSSHTQFKIKKSKKKVEKLPKLAEKDVVHEVEDEDTKVEEAPPYEIKSPKVSESHSTKLQDHVEKNETDNITKSIKKKRINQN